MASLEEAHEKKKNKKTTVLRLKMDFVSHPVRLKMNFVSHPVPGVEVG